MFASQHLTRFPPKLKRFLHPEVLRAFPGRPRGRGRGKEEKGGTFICGPHTPQNGGRAEEKRLIDRERAMKGTQGDDTQRDTCIRCMYRFCSPRLGALLSTESVPSGAMEQLLFLVSSIVPNRPRANVRARRLLWSVAVGRRGLWRGRHGERRWRNPEAPGSSTGLLHSLGGKEAGELETL